MQSRAHGHHIALGPFAIQMADHAHGLNDLGIAKLALQIATYILLRLASCRLRRFGGSASPPSQHRLHRSKAQSHHPQPRVQQEQHRNVDGCPRRIKESKDTVAR